jgi:hypothetical protein
MLMRRTFGRVTCLHNSAREMEFNRFDLRVTTAPAFKISLLYAGAEFNSLTEIFTKGEKEQRGVLEFRVPIKRDARKMLLLISLSYVALTWHEYHRKFVLFEKESSEKPSSRRRGYLSGTRSRRRNVRVYVMALPRLLLDVSGMRPLHVAVALEVPAESRSVPRKQFGPRKLHQSAPRCRRFKSSHFPGRRYQLVLHSVRTDALLVLPAFPRSAFLIYLSASAVAFTLAIPFELLSQQNEGMRRVVVRKKTRTNIIRSSLTYVCICKIQS